MKESDTRLHKIDPQLKVAGWDVGSRQGLHFSKVA